MLHLHDWFTQLNQVQDIYKAEAGICLTYKRCHNMHFSKTMTKKKKSPAVEAFYSINLSSTLTSVGYNFISLGHLT